MYKVLLVLCTIFIAALHLVHLRIYTKQEEQLEYTTSEDPLPTPSTSAGTWTESIKSFLSSLDDLRPVIRTIDGAIPSRHPKPTFLSTLPTIIDAGARIIMCNPEARKARLIQRQQEAEKRRQAAELRAAQKAEARHNARASRKAASVAPSVLRGGAYTDYAPPDHPPPSYFPPDTKKFEFDVASIASMTSDMSLHDQKRKSAAVTNEKQADTAMQHPAFRSSYSASVHPSTVKFTPQTSRAASVASHDSFVEPAYYTPPSRVPPYSPSQVDVSHDPSYFAPAGGAPIHNDETNYVHESQMQQPVLPADASGRTGVAGGFLDKREKRYAERAMKYHRKRCVAPSCWCRVPSASYRIGPFGAGLLGLGLGLAI